MDSNTFSIDIDYLFYSSHHDCFPVVDDKYKLVALVRKKCLSTHSVKENPVVIMAGGLGTRLRPYTKKTPKPLLNIGGVSIMQRILMYFHYYGFHNFYISINYLANQIQDTFGDGSHLGVNIRYLHEKEWLGTAGSIALMPCPEFPCFVTNGDLIMDVDLCSFLQQHQKTRASATMCTYNYPHEIPYGVVQSHSNNFLGIIEKPTYYFQISSGLYCLSPEVWNYLPLQKIDMPMLFETISKNGLKTYVYPHKGKWIDIGTREVFEMLSDRSSDKAQAEV